MRFDVNISVRPKGQEELGTRTETKNLNSFAFMTDCIALEVERQIEVIEDGGTIKQETRLYNGDTGEARSMRSKEEANDYRYFPCPDLLPVEISSEVIEELRGQLPELPDARAARFVESFGLSDYDAELLCSDRPTADFFEVVVKGCGDAKLAANWVSGELSAKLNTAETGIADSPVSAEALGGLIARIKDNTISGKIAKQVFEAMWNGEGDADAVIEAKGLKQMSDSGELEAIVDQVLADNADGVAQYKEADDKKRKKLLGGFMGPIMKATKGQANPGMVNKILVEKLNG
jgi:aspartyl-tRNA(Asn)/glutamyl-tRNA(Gln) amidotransferase subunit B